MRRARSAAGLSILTYAHAQSDRLSNDRSRDIGATEVSPQVAVVKHPLVRANVNCSDVRATLDRREARGAATLKRRPDGYTVTCAHCRIRFLIGGYSPGLIRAAVAGVQPQVNRLMAID